MKAFTIFFNLVCAVFILGWIGLGVVYLDETRSLKGPYLSVSRADPGWLAEVREVSGFRDSSLELLVSDHRLFLGSYRSVATLEVLAEGDWRADSAFWSADGSLVLARAWARSDPRRTSFYVGGYDFRRRMALSPGGNPLSTGFDRKMEALLQERGGRGAELEIPPPR
jgi:hypothetical protein